MSDAIAKQRPFVVEGEIRNARYSFDDALRAGDTLTGTPTIVEVTTTDLAISNKLVSTSSLVIEGETVTTGRAVTFTVTGFQRATRRYTIKMTVTAVSGETIIRYLRLPCVA